MDSRPVAEEADKQEDAMHISPIITQAEDVSSQDDKLTEILGVAVRNPGVLEVFPVSTSTIVDVILSTAASGYE